MSASLPSQEQKPQQGNGSHKKTGSTTAPPANTTSSTTAPPANAVPVATSATSTTTTAAPSSSSVPPDATKPRTHSFTVGSTVFTVDTKYSKTSDKALGRGAYGVVCAAVDKTTKRRVAIKKIPNAFDDLIDAKRIVREMKLLRHFKHQNIISLYDLVNPPDAGPYNEINMIFERMDTDLARTIYSSNQFTDDHVKLFVYQILRGLKYIHSANVIHRDLKPSNLLLNTDCELKICDFGLARGISKQEITADYELTQYVVTRWYRAPEISSGQHYDQQIDVWSTGCILAEILRRKPLFPADDHMKLLGLIFETLGTPSAEDLKMISDPAAYELLSKQKHFPKQPISKICPNANPLALDLLEKMLVFNPKKRITVDEALAHPFLKEIHDPKIEYTCESHFDFDFEKVEMTKDVLRELVWDEVLQYRPETRPIRDQFVENVRRKKEAAKAAAASSSSGASAPSATPAPNPK